MMRTLLYVTACHLLALGWLAWHRSPTHTSPPKMRVETVVLAPTPPKRESAPPPPQKSATPQKTDTPKKAEPRKKERATDELRQILQQSLSSLEEKKNRTPLPTPKVEKVGKLKSEALLVSAYEALLTEMLETALTLPEKGELKLTLTLDREGRVLAHTILSSTSNRNSAYVDKEIAHLFFPPFESRFPGEAKRTFPIVLKTS